MCATAGGGRRPAATDLLQVDVHWQDMQLLCQHTLRQGCIQVAPPGGVLLVGWRDTQP